MRGSALILSLWALLLLSAAVFAWVKFIQQDIDIASEANAMLDARALAHSGVAVAMHPLVSRMTPILQQRFARDRGYSVQLLGEGGKLNLNWIFTPPENPDPTKIEIFKRWLERRGLSFQERQTLVDCMLDWIDADNIPRLNGAEEEADYHPPNRGAFLSVDEIEQIKGSKPLVSQPGWRDDLTIYSNPGNVDLQAAPLSVLEVLPNVGDERARRFIQIRQGPDKLDGTKDDYLFKDINEAMSFLGMSGPAAQQLAAFVTLDDPTVHILSRGQSGKVYRQVEVVARKVGGQNQIFRWKEF